MNNPLSDGNNRKDETEITEELITPQRNRPWKYIPQFSDEGCRLLCVEKKEEEERDSEEGLLQYYRHNRTLEAEYPSSNVSEEDINGELEVIELANVLYGKPSKQPEEEVHEELIVPVKIKRNSEIPWPEESDCQLSSPCLERETAEEQQWKPFSSPSNHQQSQIHVEEEFPLSYVSEQGNEGLLMSDRAPNFSAETFDSNNDKPKVVWQEENLTPPLTETHQACAEVNEEIIRPEHKVHSTTRPEMFAKFDNYNRPVGDISEFADTESNAELSEQSKKDEDHSREVVEEELIVAEKVISQQRGVPVFSYDIVGELKEASDTDEKRIEYVQEFVESPEEKVIQEPRQKGNLHTDVVITSGHDNPIVAPSLSASTSTKVTGQQRNTLPAAGSSKNQNKPPHSGRTHSDGFFGFLRRRSKSKEKETKQQTEQEGNQSEGAKGKNAKTTPTMSQSKVSKTEHSSSKPSFFQKLGLGRGSKKSENQAKQISSSEEDKEPGEEVRPKAATLPRAEPRAAVQKSMQPSEGKTNIRIFEILAKSQDDEPPEERDNSKPSEKTRTEKEEERQFKVESKILPSQTIYFPASKSVDIVRSPVTVEGRDANSEPTEGKHPQTDPDTQQHTAASEKRVADAGKVPPDHYKAVGTSLKPSSVVEAAIDTQHQVDIKSHYIVAVAIDFGTALSGYAFCFLHGPDGVHMMGKWEDGDPGVINQKTPTTLLLTPDGQFHSFGFTARNNYYDLSNEEAKQWLYFDRFKMALYETQDCNPNMTIAAANGSYFSGLEAISMTLRFFRDHALREISSQSATKILNEDVLWIITVPAIWNAPAKQFMRLAAYKAEMASSDRPHQLIVALEPEAASVHICRLQLRQLVPEKPVIRPLTIAEEPPDPSDIELLSSQFNPVVRYMTVDCGGGTVDITVHELNKIDRQIQELNAATGGPHGSFAIDVEFERLLSDIFGRDLVESFRHERPAGWIGLMMAFESRKRAADPRRTNQLNVALPFAFIDYHRKTKGKSVEEAIQRYGDSRVRWSSQGMLRLTQEAMKQIFQPTLDKIKEAISNVLIAVKGIEYIFLVGGLSESGVLQCEIRDHFRDKVKKVVIPQEANLAVIKGAVAFGLNPYVITVRRSKLTYGAAVLNRFVAGKHLESKRVHKDGIEWCKDVFDVFVKAGQVIRAGDKVVRQYLPASLSQKQIVITIYCTESQDPAYITEPGVSKCANVSLDLEESRGPGLGSLETSPSTRRRIETQLLFSETEIKVTASDITTGKQVNASIDFLHV